MLKGLPVHSLLWTSISWGGQCARRQGNTNSSTLGHCARFRIGANYGPSASGRSPQPKRHWTASSCGTRKNRV